ncbi:alpha/beta fold hydrolase [Haladaptatus salinisoli]|uniref:alpha/beta fold hydrolase n=1 Tax=Haladaptatus salinisoli TaxID=2884876 RepID=UPI001D0B235F|nr:hypothetical protein [Haladaptatus salinisoli]
MNTEEGMSERPDESRTERGQLRRSGSEIHYWITGPEDGPLVACTHGASMDHRMFDPQVHRSSLQGIAF